MHADSATDVIIVVVMMTDCLRFPLNSSDDCLQADGQQWEPVNLKTSCELKTLFRKEDVHVFKTFTYTKQSTCSCTQGPLNKI